MMTHAKNTRLIFFLLILVLITTILLSLSIGYQNTSIIDLLDIIFARASDNTALIITQFRLPRIVVCLLGGASLALSGLLLQNLTKNPLADSGILGINAGAGLMISLVVGFFDFSDTITMFFTPFLAMCGGIITILSVYLISRKKNHGINPTRLIIAGVGVSSMVSGIMITVISSIDDFKVNFIVGWLSGKITGDSWSIIALFAPILIILWLITYSQSQALNIMNLNEQTALALGLNLQKQRLIVLTLSTVLASLSVILIGNITFIGLIAGHISKRLLGSDHRITMPCALLMGMLILLVSDTVGRILLVGTNIPTGLVVSVIGAPYFLYLMCRINR